MIDSKKTLVTALSTILPTEYEYFVDNSMVIPCITYVESGGSDYKGGDTLDYSYINYTIKVWSRDVKTMTEKAILVDSKMKELGFKLTGSNELVNNNLICKILNYEAVGQEGSNAWY